MSKFGNYKNKFCSFIIRNISKDKRIIRIFRQKISYGSTYNLLDIMGIGEDDIKDSLLKGELAHRIDIGDIEIVFSDIDLTSFNSEQQTFLQTAGVSLGTQGATGPTGPQGPSGSGGGGSDHTIENKNYYVDVNNGNDSNSGTELAPFQTIQKALDTIPQIIDHAIRVYIANGEYNENLQIDKNINKGFLLFSGDKVLLENEVAHTATPDHCGWNTIGTTGLTWDPGSLRGYWVRITSGTGAGSIRMIMDNQADIIWFVTSASSIPDGTSVYEIVKPGVIIDNDFKVTNGGSTEEHTLMFHDINFDSSVHVYNSKYTYFDGCIINGGESYYSSVQLGYIYGSTDNGNEWEYSYNGVYASYGFSAYNMSELFVSSSYFCPNDCDWDNSDLYFSQSVFAPGPEEDCDFSAYMCGMYWNDIRIAPYSVGCRGYFYDCIGYMWSIGFVGNSTYNERINWNIDGGSNISIWNPYSMATFDAVPLPFDGTPFNLNTGSKLYAGASGQPIKGTNGDVQVGYRMPDVWQGTNAFSVSDTMYQTKLITLPGGPNIQIQLYQKIPGGVQSGMVKVYDLTMHALLTEGDSSNQGEFTITNFDYGYISFNDAQGTHQIQLWYYVNQWSDCSLIVTS